jgi:hypothetical protein
LRFVLPHLALSSVLLDQEKGGISEAILTGLGEGTRHFGARRDILSQTRLAVRAIPLLDVIQDAGFHAEGPAQTKQVSKETYYRGKGDLI